MQGTLLPPKSLIFSFFFFFIYIFWCLHFLLPVYSRDFLSPVLRKYFDSSLGKLVTWGWIFHPQPVNARATLIVQMGKIGPSELCCWFICKINVGFWWRLGRPQPPVLAEKLRIHVDVELSGRSSGTWGDFIWVTFYGDLHLFHPNSAGSWSIISSLTCRMILFIGQSFSRDINLHLDGDAEKRQGWKISFPFPP